MSKEVMIHNDANIGGLNGNNTYVSIEFPRYIEARFDRKYHFYSLADAAKNGSGCF